MDQLESSNIELYFLGHTAWELQKIKRASFPILKP